MATKLNKPQRRKVITPIFRLTFPALFERERPMENQTSKPKYALTAVFEPSKFDAADKKRWADLQAILDEESMAAFKRPMAKLPDNFKKPIRDGAEKEHLDGFGEGTKFAKMSSHRPPGVVLSDGQTPVTFIPGDQSSIDAANDIMYSGCYCRASVTAYAFDNIAKGVALGLHNVMFVRDGDRLDGRSNPTEDFGEVAVPAGDDDDMM